MGQMKILELRARAQKEWGAEIRSARLSRRGARPGPAATRHARSKDRRLDRGPKVETGLAPSHFAARGAASRVSTETNRWRSSPTSLRRVSAGRPERRDPRPDSWGRPSAWHRAKSPRHASRYPSPIPERLLARGRARSSVRAQTPARARPPVRARGSGRAGARPLSKRSPDRKFHGGAYDASRPL